AAVEKTPRLPSSPRGADAASCVGSVSPAPSHGGDGAKLGGHADGSGGEVGKKTAILSSPVAPASSSAKLAYGTLNEQSAEPTAATAAAANSDRWNLTAEAHSLLPPRLLHHRTTATGIKLTTAPTLPLVDDDATTAMEMTAAEMVRAPRCWRKVGRAALSTCRVLRDVFQVGSVLLGLALLLALNLSDRCALDMAGAG
ncbi:unnamed protein product, partial [Phaeothamnion confervicola]